jgi:hypothetical protein
MEEKLKAMSLVAPSGALDRRVNKAFATAAVTRARDRTTILSWVFAVVIASGAAAALLFVSNGSPRPLPKQLTYRIEPQGRLRQLLFEPPARTRRLPAFVVSTSSEPHIP